MAMLTPHPGARGSVAAPVLSATCGVVLILEVISQTSVTLSARVVAGAAILTTFAILTGALGRLMRRRTPVDASVLAAMMVLEQQEADRLAGRLHRTAIQSLVVAGFLAGSTDTTHDHGELSEQLHLAELEVRDAIHSVREPGISQGFGACCAYLQEELDMREGLDVVWSWDVSPGEDRIPTAGALLAYRFLRETLANVAQHSGASAAHVSVTARAGALTVCVKDSGTGFQPPRVTAGRDGQATGLQIVAARASLLGSQLAVTSYPGTGTTVTLRVPLHADPSGSFVRLGQKPCPGPETAPAPSELMTAA